jgi:hypothetical protein
VWSNSYQLTGCYTYRGQDVTQETETKEGLHDPVIIRVGKDNQKFRLEAGNHRIQVLYKHGVPFTPATVQVENWCGPDAQNVKNTGTHNFDFPYPDILIGVSNGYAKPSSIFEDLVHTICAQQ